MISILLYGRNDNYGYNLHKRAALSFNCMAELLNEKSDEIIFVDYNTPNDFPTFPEAIRDTLTAKARDKLRILRVRPRLHEQFRPRTHLVAIEPIARNIGVRRTNPDNRWVLSTNTDMIFVIRRRAINWRPQYLSDVVRDCQPGFYHAPRIEIPETLWESLDRTRPRDAMDAIRKWGPGLHLNEIVFGSDTILYDGPGDFQLVQRNDLFKIHAFNEEMLIGWHVDSNIAKRLRLIYGKVGDLGARIFGYHCDHTRQITAMHGPSHLENDSRLFVEEVERPDLPQQAQSWGFPDEEIEEIRIRSDPSRLYVSGLLSLIGEPMENPSTASYTGATYDRVDYDSRHVLPFLIDVFSSYERKSAVAWYGTRIDTLHMFCQMWKTLGFTGAVLVDASAAKNGLATAPEAEAVEPDRLRSDASAFVFDFGAPSDRQDAILTEVPELGIHEPVVFGMLKVIEVERSRISQNQPLRRILVINAINNKYERFVQLRIGVGHTPFATRIRQGFILPLTNARQDWLPALQVGKAGIRDDRIIKTHAARLGIVAFGAYRYLDPGRYQLRLRSCRDRSIEHTIENLKPLLIEVCLEQRTVAASLVREGEHQIFFEIPEKLTSRLEYSVEIRITAVARSAFAISELTIEPLNEPFKLDSHLALEPFEWLPLLLVGHGAMKTDHGIEIDDGGERVAIYGPYLPLAAGCYVGHAKLRLQEAQQDDFDVTRFGHLEIVADASYVLSSRVIMSDNFFENKGVVDVPFEVPVAMQGQLPSLIETRLWTSGKSSFLVESVSVEPRTEGTWVSALDRGEAGCWDRAAIKSRPAQTGCVASGFFNGLKAGRYRFELELKADEQGTKVTTEELAVAIDAKVNGRSIASHGISYADFSSPTHQIVFDLPGTAVCGSNTAIEIRIVAMQPIAFTISGASLDPVADDTPVSANFLLGADWLPLLKLGPAGVRENIGTAAKKGTEGYALFGPYSPLPAGQYVAVAMLEFPEDRLTEAEHGHFDVAANGSNVLAVKNLSGNAVADGAVSIVFEVPVSTSDELLPLIETRIFTKGHSVFSVRSLTVSASSQS